MVLRRQHLQQKTATTNKDSNWSVTLDPLVLSATPAGNGLISNDGQSLTWFSIAGKDGKFVPAIAVIKNNAVELFSAEIKKPKHIRFAWNETAQPNFFNKDGLPALPFRTDHL